MHKNHFLLLKKVKEYRKCPVLNMEVSTEGTEGRNSLPDHGRHEFLRRGWTEGELRTDHYYKLNQLPGCVIFDHFFHKHFSTSFIGLNCWSKLDYSFPTCCFKYNSPAEIPHLESIIFLNYKCHRHQYFSFNFKKLIWKYTTNKLWDL